MTKAYPATVCSPRRHNGGPLVLKSAVNSRKIGGVRLHTLGDFYSVEYVRLWGRLLERHPGLHIWGYTAHWQVKDDPIAAALIEVIERFGERFAVRFSNAPIPFPHPTTITIETARQKPADAIICPEQLGKTESCSTCALCWQTRRQIAFLQH